MVYVLLGNGFEELETIAPVDILRRGGVDVKIAGIGGMSAVGCNGITVAADMAVEDVALVSGDMLVLPGGLGGMQEIEGSEIAMKLVRQAAADESMWLCAICASPTIFGRAGILQGKKAVCYPGLQGKLTGALPNGRLAGQELSKNASPAPGMDKNGVTTTYTYDGTEKKPDVKVVYETAEEIKPVLFFDEETNEVNGKCKLKPHKSYFAIEIRDKN